MRATFLSLLAYFFTTYALIIPRQNTNYNDGIHLAVSPKCGPLVGRMADVNAGIDLGNIKTIVSFGVCNCFFITFFS